MGLCFCSNTEYVCVCPCITYNYSHAYYYLYVIIARFLIVGQKTPWENGWFQGLDREIARGAWNIVLVGHCCITNHHILSSLKYTYLSSLLSHHFCRSKGQVQLKWISAQCLIRLKSRAYLGYFLIWSSESPSKLVQVVRRIHFLMIVGLDPHFLLGLVLCILL